MTTIAKLVAEIGGDPTGLTQALDQSTKKIRDFVRNSKGQFSRGSKPTDEFLNLKPEIAALESYSDTLAKLRINSARRIPPPEIDLAAAKNTIKALEQQFRLGASDIRESLFRGLTDTSGAKSQMAGLAKEFNQGILRAIETAATSGGIQSAAQIALTNALKPAGLTAGQATGRNIVAGMSASITAQNITRALAPGFQQVTAQATKAGERSGRSFAQTFTATIHRHRALIPTLTGLLLTEALSGAGEVNKATAGLNAVDAAAARASESLKATEKILHEFGMLASFILPPVPGLIAAVTAGILGSVIGMNNKLREELVKMRATFVTELNAMIDSIDQLGLQKKLEEVLQGKRSAGASQLGNFFKGGLSDLVERQRRDQSALDELNRRNQRAGGLLTLDKHFRNATNALEHLIEERKPVIAALQQQASELREAILNPIDAKAGFGGQLPAVKSTGVADGVKDITKSLNELISVYQAENAVGRESFDVLLRIRNEYAKLNAEIAKLAKSDPFSDKLLSLRELSAEVEKSLGNVLKLQGAFSGSVQTTPNLAKPTATIFDLDSLARKILIQGGSRIVDAFGIEVRLLTDEMTPLKVEFQEMKESVQEVGRGLLDAGRAIGQRLLTALNPLSIFSGLLEGVARSIAPSMEALDGPLRQLAATVSTALKPVFDALAPVIQELTPVIGAILQVLAPILKAIVPIIAAFVPILRALFPLIKAGAIIATYLFQAFATGASIFLRAIGNIIIGWGSILKALAEAIDKLPFVSARGAINAAQGVIDFGRSLLGASDEFKKSAQEMADARDVIRDLSIDDTQDAINDLGDAAAATAGVLNGPQGFRVELLRFVAQTARNAARLSPSDRTGGSGRPEDPSRAGAVVVYGDVNIDAAHLTPTQLFDAVRDIARRRSMAQFGSTQQAPETFK